LTTRIYLRRWKYFYCAKKASERDTLRDYSTEGRRQADSLSFSLTLTYSTWKEKRGANE